MNKKNLDQSMMNYKVGIYSTEIKSQIEILYDYICEKAPLVGDKDVITAMLNDTYQHFLNSSDVNDDIFMKRDLISLIKEDKINFRQVKNLYLIDKK